jgi:hypothetical protein
MSDAIGASELSSERVPLSTSCPLMDLVGGHHDTPSCWLDQINDVVKIGQPGFRTNAALLKAFLDS